MIKIEKISKSFGKNKVLNAVSFDVTEGEFVSIVGHSGTGKTTLINCIFGSEKTDNGQIFVRGVEVGGLNKKELQSYRQTVGMVFQDFKLLENSTVFENVAFALEVLGKSKNTITERVMDVLKLVGLEKYRNNFPRQLSGGEAQRCAIARALVHAPDLLIADEPTGNLDPENAKSLAELLVTLNKNGTTIILSTHNKNVVDYINKRVIKIVDGKILSDKKNSRY